MTKSCQIGLDVNIASWVVNTEGYYPEMIAKYGNCLGQYMTTAINGLSDNDFIYAVKIDRLTAK